MLVNPYPTFGNKALHPFISSLTRFISNQIHWPEIQYDETYIAIVSSILLIFKMCFISLKCGNLRIEATMSTTVASTIMNRIRTTFLSDHYRLHVYVTNQINLVSLLTPVIVEVF